MTDRGDIKTKQLQYTCNCGWIDWGHANSENERPTIGAANLWAQVRRDRPPVRRRQGRRNPLFRFPDGSTGFLVTSRQDHRRIPFRPGAEGRFIVKSGLDTFTRKRVAFAIFMAVSHQFEGFQAEWLRLGTDSGRPSGAPVRRSPRRELR